jgi:ribosomal protein S16
VVVADSRSPRDGRFIEEMAIMIRRPTGNRKNRRGKSAQVAGQWAKPSETARSLAKTGIMAKFAASRK